jgi:kumamolisin
MGRVAPLIVIGMLAAVLLCVPTAFGASARMTAVGPAPATQSLSLVLPLKTDSAGLAKFAAAVSTPGSPLYGQYESVPDLVKRFGAPATERERVLAYLRAHGATGVRIDGSGLFADATMTAGLAHRLFSAKLTEFRTAAASRFTAPTSTIRIPGGLTGAVTGVVGLDTRPLDLGHPAVAGERSTAAKASTAGAPLSASGSPFTAAAQVQSGYPSRTGTPSGCPSALRQGGFTPNQYLTAYGYDGLYSQGITGSGERAALIEINGFKASDIRTYAKCFGKRIPRVNGYLVGLKKPLKAGGEATLDLEVLDSAAPGLKGIDVYESQARASDVLQTLTRPLTNPQHKPDVISVSLGDCEKDTRDAIGGRNITVVESSLELATASGVSVLASSGDDGSTACLDQRGAPVYEKAVNYPASSKWVTGVGGTNFTLNSANQIAPLSGADYDQIVWNDDEGAGGGGFSTLFGRPSWQTGVTASSRRVVPDVSMLADPSPGYLIYCSAKGDCVNSHSSNPWVSFGGTSAGTPLLAAGLALVDEALRRDGRQDVGLANPLLYKVYRSASRAAVFNDVLAYNNDLFSFITDGAHAVGCCTAAPGFDAASGLGSVNISALAAAAVPIAPKLVAVGLSLPRQSAPVRAEHLLARVHCSGRCLMGAYTKIRIGSGKAIVQASNAYLLRRGGSRTIRIPFERAVLRKLRAAVDAHRRIVATVYGAVIDPSGNVERQSRARTLRITR